MWCMCVKFGEITFYVSDRRQVTYFDLMATLLASLNHQLYLKHATKNKKVDMKDMRNAQRVQMQLWFVKNAYRFRRKVLINLVSEIGCIGFALCAASLMITTRGVFDDILGLAQTPGLREVLVDVFVHASLLEWMCQNFHTCPQTKLWSHSPWLLLSVHEMILKEESTFNNLHINP